MLPRITSLYYSANIITIKVQSNIYMDILNHRNISINQIKKEMKLLLADNKTRYAHEISEMLNLDAMDVIKAFCQLQDEGELFVDHNQT